MLDLEVKKTIATEYIQKKDLLKGVIGIDESFAALTGEVEEGRATKNTREALEDFLVSENMFEGMVDLFTKNISAIAFLSGEKREELDKAKKIINKKNSNEEAIRSNLGLETKNKKNTKETDQQKQENTNNNMIESYAGGGLLLIDKVQENREEFSEKTKKIAKKLNINPNRLMWIMNKESGLDHRAVNDSSNATGLIQFMPDTAIDLGTTTEKLKNMSNIKQLNYVQKYYKPYKNKIRSYEDLYLATFYPLAIGKSQDYIIGSKNNREIIIGKQNKGMNNGAPITVAHVKKWIATGIPQNYVNQFDEQENIQGVA